MRSIAVFLAVFAALPLAVVFPFVGILLWAWIAFMNPHREAFGLAFDFPFNFYIALITIGAWIVSREPKRLPGGPLPFLFIAFAVVFSITTYFAYDTTYSLLRWDVHIRTIVLVLLLMILAVSKLRIQAFLWVAAISIGYFAVKGGIAVLMTGGAVKIYGPTASAIEDNNDLCLAIVMMLPILYYLRSTTVNPLVKFACLFVIACGVLAVIGTYSRGGFIGLVAVAVGYVLFQRPKVGALLIPFALGLAVWNYAPTAWFERISTIETFQSDESVAARFVAWETSWKLALDRPLLGGGFSAIETDAVDFRYNKPDWRQDADAQTKMRARAAHSIFFQVLGDHGFPGLIIWLMILGTGFYGALRVIWMSRDRKDLLWAKTLGRALVIAFIGYVAAGTFLSMAYYDLFLVLVAVTAPLQVIVARQARVDAPEETESMPLVDWRRAKG